VAEGVEGHFLGRRVADADRDLLPVGSDDLDVPRLGAELEGDRALHLHGGAALALGLGGGIALVPVVALVAADVDAGDVDGALLVHLVDLDAAVVGVGLVVVVVVVGVAILLVLVAGLLVVPRVGGEHV